MIEHSLLSRSRALLTDSVERRGFRSILALCSSSRISTFSLHSDDWIGVKYGAGPWPGDVQQGSCTSKEQNSAKLETFITERKKKTEHEDNTSMQEAQRWECFR